MRTLLVRPVPVPAVPYRRGAARSPARAFAETTPTTLPSTTVAAAGPGPIRQLRRQRQGAARWTAERLTLTPCRRRTVGSFFRYRAPPTRTWVAHCSSTITCGSARVTTATQSAPGAAGRGGRHRTHPHVRLHHNGDALIAGVGRETPLPGEPLRGVHRKSTTVRRPAATRRREPVAQMGLVLETIHYALAERTTGEPWRTRSSTASAPTAGGRRRHGHAAHAGRPRTGRLRRSVESDDPDRVLGIQRRYAEAGSDCLITNTFGGSRIMLRRHGNADGVAGSTRPRSRSRARHSATARLRSRRCRPVRWPPDRTATSPRPKSATPSASRPRPWLKPAPTPSSSRQ